MSWLPSSMAAPGGEVSCETPGTSVSVNKAEAHWLLWVHGVTSAVFCCLQASHKMAQFQREENLTSPFNEGVTREWETVAAVFEEYSLPQPTGFWEAEACIHWHCLELPGNYKEQIVGFIIAFLLLPAVGVDGCHWSCSDMERPW